MSEATHQLAAVLFVDIVGYSAMMQEDESAAVARLNHFRDVIEIICHELEGRIIQYYGDGCLLIFTSSTDAVEFGKLLQADLADEPRVPARIGIHMGDILVHNGNVFGDVVNIASRIQALAPSGGIYVSESVYRNIVNKPGIEALYIRAESLKNIRERVRIYEVLTQASPLTPLAERMEEGSNGALSRKAIAVLPFFNMSNDQDQEYFSDGLTEDIITQLSRIKALKVISRTSVMQYKKNPKPVRDIGRELGVPVILEGSVQRYQDKVRITAQLIDASSDEHLWAESYDRDVKDIFSIQREVALAIAEVLNATLTPKETQKIDFTPTVNVQAYDLWLKGKFLVEKRTKPDLLEARALYQEAAQGDSQFARAFAGLADTYLLSAFRGYEEPTRNLWMAKKEIDTALALVPSSGETQATLGYWYHQNFDWHAAEITYRRAIELNPNQSNVYLWLAILLEGKGEIEEAKMIYEQGTAINPAWVYLLKNQVRCLVNAGETEKAIILQKKLIARHADNTEKQKDLFADLARLLWYAGEKTEAISSALKAGDRGLVRFFHEGDYELLKKKVDEQYQEKEGGSEYVSRFWMGMDYAKAGDRDRALDCFNEAIALREPSVTLLLTNHYEFMNIKYLSMALLTRKVRMLVNF